jgi:translation initiation factor IF-3
LKAFVFKGRSIIYKDQGQILLLRLATDLEEFGKASMSSRRKENDYVHCSKKRVGLKSWHLKK